MRGAFSVFVAGLFVKGVGVLTVGVDSPGRYFAANELKALIAYLVINYDFKLADPAAGRPCNVYWAEHVVPNPAGKLLFRKRQSEHPRN